jgi:hypothetical protein
MCLESAEYSVLKNILNTYEKTSGQAINYAKSEVFFSRNMPTNVKGNISNILEVTKELGTGQYLSVPSMVGRNKKAVFSYLRDGTWKRI